MDTLARLHQFYSGGTGMPGRGTRYPNWMTDRTAQGNFLPEQPAFRTRDPMFNGGFMNRNKTLGSLLDYLRMNRRF